MTIAMSSRLTSATSFAWVSSASMRRSAQEALKAQPEFDRRVALERMPLAVSTDLLANDDHCRRRRRLASAQGHLSRLNHQTGEIVGCTIFDFSTEFPAPRESLQLEMPSIRMGSGETAMEASVLERVPAGE
jgi:hypothetical protein